ncbi:hypothetical protein GT354_08545, partial [Streptomyces sp. SID3343]|nr:hypothetical protein [Streptomyces sp. SID3343]
ITASTTRANAAARRLLANAGASFEPGPPAPERTNGAPDDPIDATLPVD